MSQTGFLFCRIVTDLMRNVSHYNLKTCRYYKHVVANKNTQQTLWVQVYNTNNENCQLRKENFK